MIEVISRKMDSVREIGVFYVNDIPTRSKERYVVTTNVHLLQNDDSASIDASVLFIPRERHLVYIVPVVILLNLAGSASSIRMSNCGL